MSISNHLVKKDRSLVALTDIEIIIDRQNFATNISREIDDTIVTFGVFELKAGKKTFTSTFPMEIALNVIEREITSTNLILKYTKGNVIINDMGYFPNVKNANTFVDLLITGKFNTLPPESLVDLLVQNLKLNSTRAGVPVELIEAMISELYRDSENASIPFRLVKRKNATHEILSVKDIARSGSVFGAISFEDVKKAIQSAVTITNSGQEQIESPVERILRPI